MMRRPEPHPSTVSRYGIAMVALGILASCLLAPSPAQAAATFKLRYPMGSPHSGVLVPSPIELGFPGSSLLIGSAPMTVTISNPGAALINFAAGPSISGPDASQFQLGSSTCGSVLYSGYSCTVTVRFVPYAAGTYAATLVLHAAQGAGELDIPLTGTGDTFFRAASISTGAYHTLAVRQDGSLWVSGLNNYGQLGGTASSSGFFTQIIGGGVSAAAAGAGHSLLLKSDGTVWSAGLNSSGQQGAGDTYNRSIFIKVLSGATAVFAGDYTSFAIKNGSLWAAGYNHSGQLGTGTTANQLTFTPVLSSTTSVCGNGEYVLAIANNGSLYGSGSNAYSAMGMVGTTSTTRFIPITEADGTTPVRNVTAISCGARFSILLRSDGTLWAAGDQSAGGQFGPNFPSTLTTWTLLGGGVVRAEAVNTAIIAQLADGTLTSTAPGMHPMPNASDIVSLSGGFWSANLIIRGDGTVWGAGSNQYDPLGMGAGTTSTTYADYTEVPGS